MAKSISYQHAQTSNEVGYLCTPRWIRTLLCRVSILHALCCMPADMYSDRRVPADVRAHEVLLGEVHCLLKTISPRCAVLPGGCCWLQT
jgi:hypothetical protein